MKTLRIGMICVALTLLTGAPALAQTGNDLLQQALVMEQAEGNLQEAIHLYERIVQEFEGNGALAARALVQMGQCYEKLGSQEAERAYQRVVSDYADQREFVAQARSRLLALTQPTPASAASIIQLRRVMAGRADSDSVDVLGGPYPDGLHFVRIDWNTGGLAVRTLSTGDSRPITPGDYEEGAPWGASVSPDGKLIAYNWDASAPGLDHSLRLVGTDGSGDRFLHFGSGEPSWSRDSRHIATGVGHNENSPEYSYTEIVWISVEDGSMIPLETFPNSTGDGLRSSHSPDDRFLAVEFPVEEDSARFDIALVSTEGGGTLRLLVDHPADDRLIGWVPGTDAVLFKSDRSGRWDLWAVRVSEEGIPERAFPVRRGIGEMSPLGFAADGSLFYSNYTLFVAKSVAPFDERSGRVLLEAAEPILGNHDLLSFGWSPNGDHLALVHREAERMGAGQNWPKTIRVRDMNSGTERVLTRDINPSELMWMPDGRSILAVGIDSEIAREDESKTPAGLFRIDVGTGETTRLLEFPPDEDWRNRTKVIPTADGQGVIYSHRGRLVRRDLESGREEELYRHPDLQSGLHLSPDGSELLFKVPDSTVPNGKRLMIMPSSGGEPHELLTIGGSGSAGNFNWSLDGRHIFFLQQEEGVTALMRVPREGGDPERLWETDLRLIGFPLSPDHQQVGTLTLTNEAEIWVMENLVADLEESRGGR